MPKGGAVPRKTFGTQELLHGVLVDGHTMSVDQYEEDIWSPEGYCGYKVHHYLTNPEHKPCKDEYFHKCMHTVPKETAEEKEMHRHMKTLLSSCPATSHDMHMHKKPQK